MKPGKSSHHPRVGAPANTTAIDNLFDLMEREANKDVPELALTIRIIRLIMTFSWSLNYASFG